MSFIPSGGGDKIGNLSDLTTTDKSSAVVAVNEVNGKIDAVETALAGKQDELTFDSAPTASSNNPVKSNGIKTYVDNAVSQLVNDSTNYCEIGNTLIQWGQMNISTTANSTSSKRINFPKSYANQNYFAVSVTPMASDDVTAKAATYSTTGFTAYVTDTVSATRYFSWIAVGKKA